MITILNEQRETAVAGAAASGDALWLVAADLESATGFALKPEGFCRGEVCVPVPRGREAEFVAGGKVDAARLWRHMGNPVVHDAASTTWVLGTGAGTRAEELRSLAAPDFTLPDLAGRPHTLSDYRGKRVFLVTWASW